VFALTFLCALPAVVRAEPLCPNGEIALGPGVLRAIRHGSGTGKVASNGATFVVPSGITIAPTDEPIVFAIEADREPVGKVTLDAGAMTSYRGGRHLVYRASGASLSLRQNRGGYRLAAHFANVDLDALDLGNPPRFVKQILKIGDDCFASVLACTGKANGVVCKPDHTILLAGRVVDGSGRIPLPGTMVTLIDDARLETVSVFAKADGRYVFPRQRTGTYRLRARLIGYTDTVQTDVMLADGHATRIDFTMAPTANTNEQLPASAWFSLLLDKWPDAKIRGDFTLSCGNCHQIGAYRFRRAKTEEQWRSVLTRMMTNLPPYFQETRDLLVQNVIDTYGPNATYPTLPIPPPPSGDVLNAVLYEYVLGSATSSPGCHDLELGADSRVYADAGLRWIDPATSERGVYPFVGGSHSIERGPDGTMWITQAGSDSLAEVPVDGSTPSYFPLPRIGDDQGAYPHTLRFDSHDQIWMTMTKSNHLARFDPPSATWTYKRLPEADPAEVGLSIPVAYGCDTAPDDTVWWSQLFGDRIGHYDPVGDTMKAWRPPFYGPRRLSADQDGIAWVPGYGSGVLGRFDPTIERWKVYPMPTGVQGPPGFGTSETPYNLNANRKTGQVWINGSNSDTLIRFEPETARFTAFPLPTRASFTREIEFDPDNNIWTCTSNEPPGPGERGQGKFVKLELPPPGAACGNHRIEPGEECDDGNTADCDGCSASCRLESGCGDGARCGAEQCDDGNADDCDGCDASCHVEIGLLCGDGIVNAACGEECEPPGVGGCSLQCTAVAGCGNGVMEAGEACDDGDTDDCDGCTSKCTLTAGCGDGVRCGAEECDDGNPTSCDGCSSTCAREDGATCGDGIVNAACGEECDPPQGATCAYNCRTSAPPPLGTRHISFGGALYSSALGTSVALGLPEGAFDLVADAPEANGSANITLGAPVFFRVPILGGAFGYFCGRVTSCTGHVLCNGGAPADVLVQQDSVGPGLSGNPIAITTGLGASSGPGTVVLACAQSTIQVNPPAPDCATQAYPSDQPFVYTTGAVTGEFLNGDPRIGTGRITIAGERFDCANWSTEDGPGVLAGSFLQEADPQAGDTANGLRLDD
jgi:cysteine-rich repeat protein